MNNIIIIIIEINLWDFVSIRPVVGNGSFSGLSLRKFSKEITDKLLAPVNEEDIEIKPDGNTLHNVHV